MTITVTAVNDAPVANADTFASGYEMTLVVDAANGVLDSDTDAEGNTLTVTLESGPSDDLVSTTNPATVIVTGDITITAHLETTEFYIYLPVVLRNK